MVKWFGVIYLLYLAYVQWTAPAQNIDIQTEQKNTPALVLVFKGFIVNMSNPKAIVFVGCTPAIFRFKSTAVDTICDHGDYNGRD